MPASQQKISTLIKTSAKELGFSACGIAGAEHLQDESGFFKSWLEKGYHAGMAYMNRNVDKRLNPALLNEWAHSVIVVMFNYYPGKESVLNSSYKISKYAYGKDYHDVMKDKLRQLVDIIEDEIGEITARVLVDSAPVLERAWAKRSGLGWIGKNACLINKEMGSFFFLGTIITNLELAYDKPSELSFCGNCTKCMEACPNGAIVEPGIVDARKCISYLSIEHKEEFSSEQEGMLHSCIFGCDICQDICPWNRFAKPHTEPAFLPSPALQQMKDEDWENLNKDKFDELFKGTAVERTGHDCLRRNIEHCRKE